MRRVSKENVGVRKDSDDGEDDAYDGGDAARNARKMPGACWESADVAEVIGGIKGRNSASDGESGVSSIP